MKQEIGGILLYNNLLESVLNIHIEDFIINGVFRGVPIYRTQACV